MLSENVLASLLRQPTKNRNIYNLGECFVIDSMGGGSESFQVQAINIVLSIFLGTNNASRRQSLLV